jgi:capsular exopolysaccharide synthesis family protein
MTYRDDPSHVPDEQRAMVGGAHPPGDALMVQSNGAPTTSLLIPGGPAPATSNVLRGGMDANTFLHALRRRWLLTLCTGLVAAATAAIALWFIFPESSISTALFEVSNDQDNVFDITRRTVQDFDIFKKTQLAKLKSNYVLTAAVRDPGIASLSALADEPDHVEWLQDNLIVDFPQNGEILSISLSGDEPPEDLQRLVDAVAKAYREEVIAADRQRRATNRDLLSRNLDNLQEDLKRKMDQFLAIAEESGRPAGSEGRDPETELLIRDLDATQKKRDELTNKLYDTRIEFLMLKGELDDPALIEAQVDEILKDDLQMNYMRQQLMYVEVQKSQVAGVAKRANSKAVASYDRQIEQLNRSMEQYREQIKQKLIYDRQTKPNYALLQLNKRFNLMFASLQGQLGLVTKEAEGKMEKLKARVARSTDLETREEELKQLQQISNDMSVKLESLDYAAEAPDQIRQIQSAVSIKNINTTQHYTIAIVGALAALGLTCLGVGYAEFRNRRLNGPEEVDEGLGIRVVGTLPDLSSKKALDPNHPTVAQLTESIDGVRTILMHDSTSKRRQVVLVTSPATMEGRTTVASQLAASLARAGRRTLLIDGDLRRPALHALFDVPLEDGLCEVLRAEVDVADVIRPTHAESLWLLTAGYCDIDAIHALATEQMQPVFDKLRAEYDFIIIDGAPVLGMSDALIFGQYSDGAIISVRRDQSQMPKIHQTAELLRGVGIRIIGAVVNGVPAKADERIVQMRLMAPKSERELQPTA